MTARLTPTEEDVREIAIQSREADRRADDIRLTRDLIIRAAVDAGMTKSRVAKLVEMSEVRIYQICQL